MTWSEKLFSIVTHEFKVGSIQLSLLTVFEFLVLVGIVFLVARTVRNLLFSRVLSDSGLDSGCKTSSATSSSA
jgi:small-conductance mechanosensitive channel